MSESCGHSCANCFRVLSDSTRIRILQGIKTKEANVAELTTATGVTQPTVSYHLKMLDDIGLISKVRKGRETYYSFNENFPCKGCGVFSAGIKV